MLGLSWFLGTTSLSTFNGGLTQVNLADFNFVFLDFVKTGAAWNYGGGTNANGQVSPAIMDANGYPTDTTLSNGYYTVVNIPPTTVYTGTYVVSWSGGDSSTAMRNPGTLISGSTTGANGSFTFRPNSSPEVQNVQLGPTTIGDTYINSISMVRSDQLALWQAGKIFNPDYLSTLAAGGFGVIRFLNFEGPSLITTWATRKPLSYFSYAAADEYRSSLWAGITTNSGNDYAISFGSGAPVDKQTILLQWNSAGTFISGTVSFPGSNIIDCTNHGLSAGDPVGFNGNYLPTGLSAAFTYYVSATNLTANTFSVSLTSGGAVYNYGTGASGSPIVVRLHTLNLNGTGAVAVKSSFGAAFTEITQCPSPVSQGGQACWAAVIYDADLNCWLMNGGNTNQGSAALTNGMPFEIMLELCKETGTHPWFVAPYLAVDPMTDFHAQLACYIKTNMPSWMIPRFENCNELWNTGNPQTQYAFCKSYAHWNAQFSNGQFDYWNWTGKVVSTIGQAVNAVYGGAVGSRYQIITNSQTVSWANPGANGNGNIFSSSNYVGQTQSPQSLVIPSLSLTINFTKTPASNWMTHSSIANYFNPSERGSAQETTDAATFWANAAEISGGISGNTLTVSNVINGTVTTGAVVTDQYGFVISGTEITGGGGSSWTVNNSQSIASGTTLYCINPTANALASSYVDTCGGAANNVTQPGNLAYCKNLYVNMFNYISGITNNAGNALKMNFYEGGYSPDLNDTQEINFLRDISKFTADAGLTLTGGTLANSDVVAGNYHDCIAAGGEFPSLFQLTGSNNIWSILDPDIYGSPRIPQWQAIAAFNG